jgi:hypothetical protein
MKGIMGRLSLVLAAVLVCFSLPSAAEPFSLRNAPVVSAQGSAGAGEALRIPEPSAIFQNQDGGGAVDARKSKSKAVLYSLLLPGFGHYYVGDRTGARTFFAVEAATWTSFIVFQVQGHRREEGYRDYAQVFAGISGSDHSDAYYSLIAEYNSWVEYEQDVKNEGRFALYPKTDAATLDEYFVENRVSDYEQWNWRSSDVRRDFRSLRSSSKRSYRRALYAVAVAAANRAASAFFVIKATNDANRRLEGDRVGYRLEFGPPVAHPGDGFQTGLSIVATF